LTAFTELVGCRLPLQLAGMGGGTSDVGLTAAVSNAGGLGMLGAGGLPAVAVEPMLDAVASATDQPFGVNFLMPFLDRDAVRSAAKRARVVDFMYGDPDRELVDLVHDGGALAGWQVGSAQEASAAQSAGCDFVVAQGTEAGGHVRGTQPLAELLKETKIDVPVVAAGGLGDASDVATAFDSGASAVRIGTRFLAATESIAHPEYIDALIEATSDDTVLTEAFSVGWPNAPHRVLRSCVEAAHATTDDVVGTFTLGAEQMPVVRFSTPPPLQGASGNIRAMALYAGTSVGSVTERQPAAEIVEELLGQSNVRP
jgi:NAD(P)H-dependent flavin oxidoreductase YrpB (nitropropane dioxygenase family)